MTNFSHIWCVRNDNESMTRSSRRKQEGIHIDLSEIKYDSTCISLNVPVTMSCDICRPKLEANNGLQKKSSAKPKRFRDYSSRRKCRQLWLSKYGEKHRHSSTIHLHIRIRNYFNIKQNIVIDYTDYFCSPQKKQRIEATEANCYPTLQKRKAAEDNNHLNCNTYSTEQSCSKCAITSPIWNPDPALDSLAVPSTSTTHLKLSPLPNYPDTVLLVREIVATKLDNMIKTLEQSKSVIQTNNPDTVLLVREVVATKLDDMIKTLEEKQKLSPPTLESFLSRKYPLVYKSTLDSTDTTLWKSNRVVHTNTWRNRKKCEELSRYLQVLSSNNLDNASFLLTSLFRTNRELKERIEADKVSNINYAIVNSIKLFVQGQLKSYGCKEKEEKEALRTILSACTSNLDKQINKNIVREAIGMSCSLFYKQMKNASRTVQKEKYKHLKRKVKEKHATMMMKKCVQEFCHSDEASRIDSNSHRIVDVRLPNGDVEKHVGRVWSVLTVNEQHQLFKQSRTVSNYKFFYEDDGFCTPSRSFFQKHKCPCVRRPTTQSCVDIIVSSMQHYMRAIESFLRANRAFKQQLYGCMCPHHEWEKMLGSTVECMVEATCCTKTTHKHLTCGIGKRARDPSFLGWKCVRNECDACGVEKKLGITKCKLWNECELEADVLEWVMAPRQGTKNGKQNTQLELGQRRYKVREIISKMVTKLNQCRLHQAEYEWRGWMKKIDFVMSNSDHHRVICTDFGATLDLFASEKDNSSVNNHAVLCIFFVLYNWRRVKYMKNENEWDETVVNDCDRWLVFGDTISRGKKMIMFSIIAV